MSNEITALSDAPVGWVNGSEFGCAVLERPGTESAIQRIEQELTGIAEEIDRDLQVVRQILREPLKNEFAPGLTGPQLRVLQALVQPDCLALPEGLNAMSLKDLSHRVGLAHSTVSGIVDRLESRGLVQRLESPSDRRLTRIVVTPAAVDFVQKHVPTLSPLVTALERTTPGHRTAILESIRSLRTLLESKRRLVQK